MNVPKGFTTNGKMWANGDPQLGGIIDCAIVGGEWFVIFNDSDINNLDGFESCEKAFEAFNAAIAAKYITE
ncbi:hypothetical protein D3C76_165710 [compost metagenome]